MILGSKMEDGTTYTNGDFEIVEDEVRYSGFDMNLGGLITMPKVNIGIACRLPFDLKDEGDWTYSESFSGVAYDTTGKYLETSYNFPLMLGFGIAFKPTDKLTLAGDFEMRKYSNTEREWTDNGIDYTQDQNWEDCNQFRIGMEYVFVGPNTVFPVRLGFRTDPKTFNGYTGTFTAPDSAQVVGKVITGGFGMKFGNIWFDLAAEYGTATYNDQEESGVSLVSKGNDLNVLASCVVHF